jgi:hypothetical protein
MSSWGLCLPACCLGFGSQSQFGLGGRERKGRGVLRHEPLALQVKHHDQHSSSTWSTTTLGQSKLDRKFCRGVLDHMRKLFWFPACQNLLPGISADTTNHVSATRPITRASITGCRSKLPFSPSGRALPASVRSRVTRQRRFAAPRPTPSATYYVEARVTRSAHD